VIGNAKKARIFVVDDESIIASTLAIILKQDGFDAAPFSEPEKALEATRSDVPDLLISDVVMPGISGIDLAIRVREVNPGCKVLLFSGQSSTADLLEAARAAGHDFELLSKPIHPTDFLKRIESVTTQSAR
jgi:DNA-binding NtrC family response regulator